jgi:hypothetical protein
MSAPARWLLVVSRTQPDLYRHLTRRFLDIAFVEVLVDRRRAERRRRRGSPAPDRRQAERRRSLTAQEREHWTALGYRLVRHGEPELERAAVSDSA